MQDLSVQHSYLDPRNLRPMTSAEARAVLDEGLDFRALGINLDVTQAARMMANMQLAGVAHSGLGDGFAMDTALTGLISTASINTPVQFLQAWLPGFVQFITKARKIDKLIGRATIGAWEDEEVVQAARELTGVAIPYTDLGNVPLTSWNTNFERRTVVRFEQGMRVGKLEDMRAARMRMNSAEGKREAVALALEVIRNKIGFFGYNGGANRTYGFLTDPNLPAYVTVANPGSGTSWSVKTFLQITADLRVAIQALRTQSGDTIAPDEIELTLAVPTNSMEYLTTTSDFGYSVRNWLTENYPKIRIESAPELVAANGGANVFYLYAEKVDDGSTDDGRVFSQNVPTTFMVLGVQQLAKGYEEDYTNATAGVLLKRPYAVVRYSGI